MALDISRLKDSNLFLKQLFDNLTSAILLLDTEVIVHAFNRSSENLFLTTENEAIQKKCGNAIGCIHTVEEDEECGKTTHCDNCILRQSVLNSFHSGKTIENQLMENEFKIGNQVFKKWFKFSVQYMECESEEMALVILDDITIDHMKSEQIKRKNFELEESLKFKERVTRMMVHDLRNPISSILSVSDLIKDSLQKDHGREALVFADIINERSSFSLGMMDDLLELSMLNTSHVVIKEKEIEYIPFVSSLIDKFDFKATKAGIELQFASTVDPQITLLFDPVKIEQVIANLISNAIKYSFSDSTIQVLITEREDSIITKVVDQGQGIRQEHHERIFKEFPKTGNIPTNGEKSVGVGLTITKLLVEAHGGKIDFESEFTKGSTFYFTLNKMAETVSILD